jgi:hypothetical protein
MAKLWPTATSAMTAGYSKRENCNSKDKAGHVGNELLRRVVEGGFSPEAFPARTFLLPERERDLKERGLVFGGNIIALLASFDPASQSWRTSQHSLFGELTLYSGRWPKSGLMRSGTAYERQTWVRRTEGTESGLLPTPKSSPSGPDFARANREGSGGDDLATAVAKWPTPRASEWKGVGPLDSKSQAYRLEKGYLDATVQDREQQTGQLSPDWVDALMGYPVGWTDGRKDFRVSLLASPTG